ncbi:MAG: hypothetical protein COA79_00925 [Planctomycetota bacterium]|nr:MAG: hypothetical protein COA79_00925 [Planctomycetota bacterium]
MPPSKSLNYLAWMKRFSPQEIKGIYFFYDAKDSSNTNDFFKKEAFDLISKAISTQQDEQISELVFNIQSKRGSGFSHTIASVFDEIYNQDMFSPSKLIMISAPSSWYKEVEEEIFRLLEKPVEGVYIIFNSTPIDSRRKLGKLVKKSFDPIEFPRMFDQPPSWVQNSNDNENDYTKWITERVKKYNKTISFKNAMILLSISGGSLQTLDNELNALSIYDNRSKEIKEEHIRAIIRQPAGVSIYKVIDKVMEGNLTTALKFIRRVFQHGVMTEGGKLEVDESVIFSVYFLPNLHRRISRVVEITYQMRMGLSLKEACLELGVPPYFQNSLSKDLNTFKKSSMVGLAFELMMDADIKSKSSINKGGWLAESIILKLLRN